MTTSDKQKIQKRALQKIQKKPLIYRAFFYYSKPFLTKLNYYFLRKKWQKHADQRTLNWNWKKINYNRVAVVNLLLKKFQDPAYLEIGCDNNCLFDSIPTLKKIGVDPLRGGNIKKTSDSFFNSNTYQFDVIFIDGLHTYQQVRKDIINSIKSIRQGGYILIHDMLPRDWIQQHIPILLDSGWTGDVWKVAFELIETKGIEFKILKIDQGVGVIKVINKNTLLKNSTSLLKSKQFSYYYDNLNKLPIIEWLDAQQWLCS